MPHRKNFRDLRSKMSPASRRRAAEQAAKLLAEMPLQELRQARQLSQQTLADVLGVAQPEISKLEHRTDVYVSTLRRYIEAMGGELQIRASFPEGSVEITQFQALEPA